MRERNIRVHLKNQRHCGISAKYKRPSKLGQSGALFVLLSFHPGRLPEKGPNLFHFSLIERVRQKPGSMEAERRLFPTDVVRPRIIKS